MPSKQQSIILGGLVTTVLSTSYLSLVNMLCCAGVLIGAVITIWHYTDTYDLTLKSGDGAVMGILAALFGLVVASVINYFLMSLGIRHDQVIAQWMIDMASGSMSPEQYDAAMEQMNAPITLSKVLIGFAQGAVAYIIFGAIGGVIGAKMFKKGGDEPTEFSD